MTVAAVEDPVPHGACSACLARTWLLARLAGHLELPRARIAELLALDDDELIAAVGGRERDTIARERAAFDAATARSAAGAASLALLCRCQSSYPARLHDLPAPPAVLHVAGGLERFLAACRRDPVAVVGTRAPSAYGADVARALGRRLATAGVTVVSGLARGVDAAAHRGALSAEVEADRPHPGAPTVAVLPAGAERPYPAGHRALHAALIDHGAVISELPPGTSVRRWMFAARNRLIAALSGVTVVVEAGLRSGSLVTARVAEELGREVGAVPGRVTTPQAAGPLALLAGGAGLVRDAQDVLEWVFGAGAPVVEDRRPALSLSQTALIRELESGRDTLAALAGAVGSTETALVELAALELAGWVRRGAGGRYSVVP